MPEDCSWSDARDALGDLCIMLGTHYDLAPRAVDALETLATEDDSILEEATNNWKTIVDVSSDVSESKTVSSSEVETPNDFDTLRNSNRRWMQIRVGTGSQRFVDNTIKPSTHFFRRRFLNLCHGQTLGSSHLFQLSHERALLLS